MITYAGLNNEISSYVANEFDLSQLKEKYTSQLNRIDAFMEKFLDKFGNRVMGDYESTPEWKLYKSKNEEYNVYARAIRNVDYFIAKKALAQR